MKQQGTLTPLATLKRSIISVRKVLPENAKKINRNSIVYDKFEAILSNLSACPLVDIKRLSANQLHLEIDSKWCHVYNEMHRGKCSP